MKILYRLFFVFLATLFLTSSLIYAATVTIGGKLVDENLILQPVNGKYSVTYVESAPSELNTDQQISFLVVEGIAILPNELTISADTIKYIDQADSTETSVSFLNFIPSTIPNCTVLIGGLVGLDGPRIIGYIVSPGPTNISGTANYISGLNNRVASITLTEMAMPSYSPTTNSYSTQTNVNKQFSFDLLPEGVYQLVATAQSHAKYTKNNLNFFGLDKEGIVCNLLSGDIDGNDVIEFLDLSAILTNYNQTKNDPADVDGNGVIEFLDLSAVLSNYNKNAIVE